MGRDEVPGCTGRQMASQRSTFKGDRTQSGECGGAFDKQRDDSEHIASSSTGEMKSRFRVEK